MDTPKITEIFDMIERGEDLLDISKKFASQSQIDLLWRCAVVREFDKPLVDEILRNCPSKIMPEEVAFEFLTYHPSVELAPRSKETYRVSQFERDKFLAEAINRMRREDFRLLSKKLVEHYEQRNDTIEALYHRAAYDPGSALTEFEKMFDQAEEAFDLARCSNLISLFFDRPELPEELTRSRNQRVARLNARMLWADEFYRTGSYLERKLLTSDLSNLFEDGGQRKWIYQIHAAGGTGKTMFLRWAVSRWCVPRGIPCARIDFDDANPLELADQPRQLILEIARQWNRQLTGTPLALLIDRLSGTSEIQKKAEKTAEETARQLSTAIPKDLRALVVLDTLEEVLIPHQPALLKIIRQLRQLHELSPGIRLVLSGRYDLQRRLSKEESSWLAEEAMNREIDRFTEDEAQKYMIQLRGLPIENRVLAAIKRSDGNPLKLWLYSILLKETDLSEQEIREDSGVDVEYLIRRVILRIGENERDPISGKVKDKHLQLRWVLRYGVVPRRLTLDFLKTDFMLNRLKRESSGEGGRDNPDIGLSTKLVEAKVFDRTPSSIAFDIDSLWSDLKAYAGESSWVRVATDSGDSEALRFTPDVLYPMRNLLLKQERKLFIDIHTEAFRYFGQKAQLALSTQQSNRIEWLLQLTYHDFQRRGERAGPAWRKLIQSSELSNRPEWRLRLASEVVERTYINDDDPPKPKLREDHRLMISPSDLALAYYFQAKARADLVAVGEVDSAQNWTEASSAFNRFRVAARDLPNSKSLPSISDIELLGATIDANVAGGDKDEALARLKSLNSSRVIATKAAAMREEVKLLVRNGSAEAEAVTQEWLAVTKGRVSLAEIVEMREILSLQQTTFDRQQQALESCDTAIVEARKLRSPELEARMDLLGRKILLQSARPILATEERRLQQGAWASIKPKPATWSIAASFLEAESVLDQGDPRSALEIFRIARDQRRKIIRIEQSNLDILPEIPATREIRAQIAIALKDYPRASEHLNAAKSEWIQLRRVNDADRIIARAASFYLDEMGDLVGAKSQLDQASRNADLSKSEWALRIELLRAKRYQMLGDNLEARNIVENCFKRIGPDSPPRFSVASAIVGLSVSEQTSAEFYFEKLVESLATVTPATARAAMLREFEHCLSLKDLAPHLVQRFTSLLPDLSDETLRPLERGLVCMNLVEALRAIGQPERALDRLDEARNILLGEKRTSFPLLNLLRAEDRLGQHANAFSRGEDLLPRFAKEFSKDVERLLCATIWLDQAERALLVGSDFSVAAASGAIHEAERRLQKSDAAWSVQLTARLNRAKATLYARRGDSESANQYRDAASYHYKQLGNTSISIPLIVQVEGKSRIRISSDKVDASSKPISNLFPGHAAFTMRIDGRNRQAVSISIMKPDEPRKKARRSSPITHLLNLSSCWQVNLNDGAAPLQLLLAMNESCKDLADELSSKLSIDDVLRQKRYTRKPDNRPDLRLETSDRLFDSIPLELLLTSTQEKEFLARSKYVCWFYRSRTEPNVGPVSIHWLQYALGLVSDRGLRLDGLDSPRLRSAIMKFQKDTGLPASGTADAPTRWMLDRYLSGLRNSTSRGVLIIGGDPVGRDLYFQYDRQRFEVFRFSGDGPSLPEYKSMVRGTTISVIHVAAGLSEEPSLGVHFNLNSGDLRERPDRWGGIVTVQALNEFLRSFSETELKPLVILDPPRPTSSFEALRQLFLRNAFAADLYRLGNAPTILGIGLGNIDRDEMISLIASGQPIGRIAKQLRESVRAESDLDDLIGTVGTALFAHDAGSNAPGTGTPVFPKESFTSERTSPMSRNVFALLVGIDSYPNPIPTLHGCVNDITAFESYLSERVAKENGVGLKLCTLKNNEATRQAIIDGFRMHLCQAGPEDVVVFYFSGHGSQEHAPEEFWQFEPDKLDETLVCYDSRSPGGWDLADKELAKLLAEVSQKGPHVSVILDCCHSGSGTRNISEVVRRAPIDLRKRPLESFIMTTQEVAAAQAASSSTSSGWHGLLGNRHVLIAACREHELAKECVRDGQHRGALSYYLGDALKNATGIPTYRDLFARTSAMVVSQIANQSPQLEASRNDDLDAVFLDGAIQPMPSSFTASFQNGLWLINGGLTSGIPDVSGTERIRLALFPFASTANDLEDFSKAVMIAAVEQVLPSTSYLEIASDNQLDIKQVYKARIFDLPIPRIAVEAIGELQACELVQNAISCASPEGKASLYIRKADEGEVPQYRIIAREKRYVIANYGSDRPLVAEIPEWNSESANLAVRRLEHIVRWYQTSKLRNPASTIQSGDVRLTLLVDSKEIRADNVRLEYRDVNGKQVPPTFQLSMTNLSQRTLFCGLLDLTQRYQVSAGLLDSGCVRLEPGETVWAYRGKQIYATVPDEIWKQGVVEYTDILKLIVCTQEFDARLLEQPSLELQGTKSRQPTIGTRGMSRDGSLRRLMNKVQTRDLGFGEPTNIDDWQTWEVSFTTVRPQETTAVPDSGKSAILTGGVKLDGHASFRAQARLTNASLSTRDIGDVKLPVLLSETSEFVEPLLFSTSRGNDPGLSVLELTDVLDSTKVTTQSPLRVTIPFSLKPNEQVLPFAFDGEFFLPLGKVESRSSDSAVISIERLPPPLVNSRSLSGAIKIFFQKTISRFLGSEYSYPQLAAVDVSSDGTIKTTRDSIEIGDRVARANRILLFVHGIIGDTKNMVPCVQSVKLPNGEPLSSQYDLILAFDYENLGTSIKQTAAELKQRLSAIRLNEKHGKNLDIVAHSMGGLVSRWFIEKEGGHEIASRLVMLGTPNGGSPWPRVVDWATVALGLGLNQLTAVAWPVSVVAHLASLIESPLLALNEMLSTSSVVSELKSSQDPGVPYFMIGGNTSIIRAEDSSSQEANSSKIQRLFTRLTSPEILHQVANPFFLGQANDIAVSIASMRDLDQDQSRALTFSSVACDHLTYFSDLAGQKALAQALADPIAAKARKG